MVDFEEIWSGLLLSFTVDEAMIEEQGLIGKAYATFVFSAAHFPDYLDNDVYRTKLEYNRLVMLSERCRMIFTFACACRWCIFTALANSPNVKVWLSLQSIDFAIDQDFK